MLSCQSHWRVGKEKKHGGREAGGRKTENVDGLNVCELEAKMTIHDLHIFARNGTCLFYKEWQRKKSSNMPKDEVIYSPWS